MRLLADINEQILKDTIMTLEGFDNATKILSAEKTPSLNLVFPTKHKLLKRLQPSAVNSTTLARNVEQYFAILPAHVMLDPLQKANSYIVILLAAKLDLQTKANKKFGQ